jgi:hypothetical protein
VNQTGTLFSHHQTLKGLYHANNPHALLTHACADAIANGASAVESEAMRIDTVTAEDLSHKNTSLYSSSVSTKTTHQTCALTESDENGDDAASDLARAAHDVLNGDHAGFAIPRIDVSETYENGELLPGLAHRLHAHGILSTAERDTVLHEHKTSPLDASLTLLRAWEKKKDVKLGPTSLVPPTDVFSNLRPTTFRPDVLRTMCGDSFQTVCDFLCQTFENGANIGFEATRGRADHENPPHPDANADEAVAKS